MNPPLAIIQSAPMAAATSISLTVYKYSVLITDKTFILTPIAIILICNKRKKKKNETKIITDIPIFPLDMYLNRSLSNYDLNT